jgi:ABC-type transport system involved in multi-copper enzyme maturation permease subunit
MVSRGVRRANVMSAKLAASLGLALILALVFTIVLTLGSVGAENSGGLGSLTASDLLGVFGVALLMFTAYMLFGALVGTFFTSSGSAMAIGLVLAFVSASFYFNLTPEDDFIFLSLFSPVSLGYNFNSLMYYVWRAGEESSRYRDVIPSVAVVLAYSSIFVGFIYGIFSKKQLRG